MIGGQVADVMSCGLGEITEDTVRFIHTRKTAALISASIAMGALTGGASDAEMELARQYGAGIGLAFQIVDDILDIVSSDEVLGKDVGSDQDMDKATYPKAIGLEASKAKARELVTEACGNLDKIDHDTAILKGLAQFVIERVY